MNPVNIVVVGSLNMDLVVRAAHFASPGQTLTGSEFHTFPGGKGANQAVAAARLGAKVSLIGAVGEDAFGQALRHTLAEEGIDTAAVRTLADTPTGVALITLAGTENQIIVVPGANGGVDEHAPAAHEALFAQADVVLAQMEIPLATVTAAAALAKRYHKPFILNPAPAQPLPRALLADVTLLTPNHTELATVLGMDAHTPLETLLRHCPCPVLVTQGAQGVLWRDDASGCLKHWAAYAVDAVDSTGAGDTFNGALAAFWHEGLSTAIRKATAAAALAVTQNGAQTAMPRANALEDFLVQHSEAAR